MPDNLALKLGPWLRRLPGLANLLLVVAIGLVAARLFWLLWPNAGQPVPAAAAAEPALERAAAVSIDQIAAANLFGDRAAATSAATQKIIDAPETNLNLTLTGIVASAEGPRSRALIENEQGEERPYAIGQTIAAGVDLHAIYTNRVILDRNGRFETLTLERAKMEAAVERVDGGETVGAELTADLAALRQQILAQPTTLANYLRLQPERDNGNLVGYRVYPGQERGLFQRVGLRPGELVTQVNGVALTSQSQALQVLGTLAQAPQISLTLRRGGQERTITVTFE